MLLVLRNAFWGLAIFAVVVLAVGLLDGALRNFLPALGDMPVGPTDFATWAQLLALGIAFFFAGYLVRGHFRGRLPLIWILLPIVVLYAIALLQTPYAYMCSAAYPFSCLVANSPFLIGIVASTLGYFFRTLRGSPRAPVG